MPVARRRARWTQFSRPQVKGAGSVWRRPKRMTRTRLTQFPRRSVPPSIYLNSQRVPPRPCRAGHLIPLATDLVVGGPFAPPDAAELVVDLAAGRHGADHDDHDAEERRDHREDSADHAVAGGIAAEEVRHVHRRGDRVRREQHRAEDGEREELPTLDPLRAEDLATPDQEGSRQWRGQQRRAELEPTTPQHGVEEAIEPEVQREAADPEQPVEGVANAQRAEFPGLLE